MKFNYANPTLSTLLLNISFGIILLAHGLLKLFVFTVAGTVAFFVSLGLPAIAAYLTIFAEIAAGLALILGILPRLAAAGSLPLLIGATFVHVGNGWVFSNQGGGWEFPALLVILAITIALQAPLSYSLGKLLSKS